MIFHCVFLRFKASVQAAEKREIFDAVAALKPLIPGMIDVKSGSNVSREGLNGGFVDGFIVTFEDAKSRDDYLAHPEHVKVGERIIAALDGGLSGLLVFDMNA